MIESIEGKRGLPRHRPPYVAQVGIFDRPTLVNNVETLFWVREIVEKGAEWFAAKARVTQRPSKLSGIGRVKEPGVKLVPAGVTVRGLIEEHCGGMAEGHTFKGYLPGGASGGILPASIMGDLPLDFGKLEGTRLLRRLPRGGHSFGSRSHGRCRPQSHAFLRGRKLRAMYAMSSRHGEIRQIDGSRQWDEGLLIELGACMGDASICGLGQAANPMFSVLKHFREDVT